MASLEILVMLKGVMDKGLGNSTLELLPYHFLSYCSAMPGALTFVQDGSALTKTATGKGK